MSITDRLQDSGLQVLGIFTDAATRRVASEINGAADRIAGTDGGALRQEDLQDIPNSYSDAGRIANPTTTSTGVSDSPSNIGTPGPKQQLPGWAMPLGIAAVGVVGLVAAVAIAKRGK